MGIERVVADTISYSAFIVEDMVALMFNAKWRAERPERAESRDWSEIEQMSHMSNGSDPGQLQSLQQTSEFLQN